MNELKKIRATKYKNKQRYKDKTKIIPKPENKDHTEPDNLSDKIIIDDKDESRSFERRGIESNWYRYEPKEEDSVVHAKDFSLIASAPISQGSYFQFKSDKIISNEVESEQVVSKLFHLDLDTLNKSLVTIPFYERCDMDERYLTELQMNEMNQKAKDSVRFYEKHLEKIQHDQQKEKELKSKTELCNNQNSKMFEELSIQEAQGGKPQKGTDITPEQIAESEDLEQWLDDILDD